MDQETSAFQEFLQGNRELTLPSGIKVSIPPLTWGNELKIYKILTKVLKELSPPTTEEVTPETLTLTPEQVYTFITMFADEVTSIAAIALGKDEAWVSEHLTSEDITGFILPLSLNIFSKVNKGMTNAFVKLTEAEQ